ncbi:MAG: M28 family peptidase [Promethearchaeota archaeon]|nr:MAG: M28 family peptidase [Candidatus Lokiarchaeota archaeon]
MLYNSNKKKLEYHNIKKYVFDLAFDRSATSTGETKTVKYIQRELDKSNIITKIEYFYWTNIIRISMKTMYLVLISYLLFYRLYLLIVAFFFFKYLFQKTRDISFTKKERSKNLIARLKAKKRKKNRPVIILSAHYDSISSRIPYKTQKILLFLARVIILPYIALSIFISISLTLNILLITSFNNIIFYLISICSLISLVFGVPIFLFLFTSTRSTGSIDNASGVSILIELAKNFKVNPLNNYDLIFVFCGSEEWGLKGSKNYVKRNYVKLNRKYNLNESFNINLDMVGSYIGLLNKTGIFKKKNLNRNLNERLLESSQKLNIPIELYDKIIKPKSDYHSFQKLKKLTKSNFEVACFHSDRDSIYIHSRDDTPDKCYEEILGGCYEIIDDCILVIDS